MSEAPDRAAQIAQMVESGAAPDAAYAERMIDARLGEAQDPAVAADDARNAPRPEHIPEKFWDAEKGEVRMDALLNSYTELEKKFRTGEKPEGEAKPEGEGEPKEADSIRLNREEKKAEEGKDGEGDNPVAAELAKHGISFDAVNDEYQKNGGNVSEETLGKLEQAFGKEVVQTYFQGLKALESAALLSAYEAAGGKETFDRAAQWGLEQLSDEDLASYNTLVANPTTQKQGIEWLVSKYRAANPSEGNLIDTAPGGANLTDVFTSRDQVTAAMRDPRYQRIDGVGAAYRQEVAEKLARSRKAGALESTVERFQPT